MQTEIPIPAQPPETAKFKRGEIAYVFNGNRHSRGVFVRIVEHYDHKSVYRVADSVGEMIVRVQDLMSQEELNDMLARRDAVLKDEKEQADRSRLAEVMELWHAGMRDAKTMAGMRGGPVVKWYKKIESAMRLGFIK